MAVEVKFPSCSLAIVRKKQRRLFFNCAGKNQRRTSRSNNNACKQSRFLPTGFLHGVTLSPLHIARYEGCAASVCVSGANTGRARRTGFIEKQSGNSGEYVAQNEKSISCTDALFTVSRDKFFSVSLRRISA